MIKKVKSLPAFALLLSLSLSVVSPALATNVNTSLTRETGGGNSPIVKAKWEMNVTRGATNNGYLGTDDSTDANAQFQPTGVYQSPKRIAVCAIVTDPDGVADINKVYADTYYPNVYLGPNHESQRQGCQQQMSEFTMTPLSKADGIELFCNRLKNSNTNLPTFGSTNYSYASLCANDGNLWKETAYVYCGERDLSYEDPSGDYKTLVLAQDKAGMDGTLVNYFKYLSLTAFETDFSQVSYGGVKLNTHKIIDGDLLWGSPVNTGAASVRNIGNTRLIMKVQENDMGLGKTDGNWNVQYDGRIGSDAAFTTFWPDTLTPLVKPLNLSETNEMDFSIDITKFPPDHVGSSYTGTMVLSAVPTDHLSCSGTTTPPVDEDEGL
jgi:hypothetical protein